MVNGEANVVFKMGSLDYAVLVSFNGLSTVPCLEGRSNNEHRVSKRRKEIFHCEVADDLMDSLHH